MRKKPTKKQLILIIIAAVVVVAALTAIIVTVVQKREANSIFDKSDNLNVFDTSLPDESKIYATRNEALANGGGWYPTMIENFDSDTLPALWNYSPHGKRNTEFWCDDMVSFSDGYCIIKAMTDPNHSCEYCKDALAAEDREYRDSFRNEYTGGIETRYFNENGNNIQTFSQAFGYYEVRVQLPKAEGMWAAFWLQSINQGKIGNEGMDGTEIDVFESAFKNVEGNKMGHALLYDGYADYSKVLGYINTNENDLYDGFHTFALKWSPEAYVFYVDGVARWASDFGGVSKVPEFLRLTCEIRHGYGPHGMVLNEFDATTENPATFLVDYVKVYQNTDYEPYIQSDDDFVSTLDSEKS